MRGARSLIVVMVAVAGTGAAFVVACSSTPLPASGSSSGTSGGAAQGDGGATDAGAADADAGGKKAYGEGPCSSDAECATGHCFRGGSGGGGGGGGGGSGETYCTAACTLESFAAVCLPPLNGKCSGTGLCRKP